MKADMESEIQQIVELQTRISKRLDQLGFVHDDDASGNIIHHLAELSVWGRRLSQEVLPAFLTLPPEKKEELGDLVVDMNYELTEMKEAIEDMEPAIISLMNFLTRE